jgi:hypothetical protein
VAGPDKLLQGALEELAGKLTFMKLTNNHNLPQPIYDACAKDPYTKGDADYSITGLLRPARIARLEALHDDAIEIDVADRVAALFGSAVHAVLERAERTALAEKRFYATIGGKRISGQTDRLVLDADLLQDYKFTSVSKFSNGVPSEFEAQVNAYCWLLHKNGHTIRRAEIVAILGDWKESQASRREDYPRIPVPIYSVPLWPIEKVEAFLISRIKAHEDAWGQLPECTEEERWYTGDQWAVRRAGSTKAVRVYSTLYEAQEHRKAFAASDYEIEFRKGVEKRCPRWCSVAPFCEQYQRIKAVT